VPRHPRLQYENAIYHIVTRGDGRRKLFHDSGHYRRFTEGLIDDVDRSFTPLWVTYVLLSRLLCRAPTSIFQCTNFDVGSPAISVEWLNESRL
jgi:hypothetical protein